MTSTIRRSTPPYDRRFCARMPCCNRAEVVFGARPHCLDCANEARAFVDAVCKREADGIALSLADDFSLSLVIP